MTHKVKSRLMNIFMALALVISALAGVLPVPNIKAEAEPDYLTFTAEEDGSSVTVKLKSGAALQYSKGNGDWKTYDKTAVALNKGEAVHFRGSGNTVLFNQLNHVKTKGKVACSGNIMTLLNYKDPASATMGEKCFAYMFYNCKGLTSAPALPATTLEDSCYYQMFSGCTELTSAPALPATTLASSCYYQMFYGCTGLTSAPALPATSLADSCYYDMFYGCTGLTSAPALPATTLADSCYCQMFYGCTGLKEAPALPATTMANKCYYEMFYGCTGLTNAPALPATALANNCYDSMFYGCTGLTSAPALPATTLANNCYYQMFYGCTGLTEAPALPATTLAKSCYYSMFSGCTGLTKAPALPATTLATFCCQSMFSGCIGLTEPPVLPATSLADSCYSYMFFNCTGIKLSETQDKYYNTEYRIPASGEGTTANNPLSHMFRDTGGTFTGTPSINTIYYIHKEAAVTYTKVEAKAATYEEAGNIEYYTDGNGNYYTCDNTDYTLVTADAVVIPRLTPYMQIDTDSSNGVEVNICAPLPEGEDINNYSIKLGDTVQPFSACNPVEINGTTYYLVKVTCPAKNMADEYAYEVQKNGAAQAVASGEVSVRDYADTVIKGNYTDPVKKICRAMLAYGASAQTYFNHNTEDLANKNNREGDGADYSTVEIPESVFDKTGLNAALEEAGAPVEYVGMSLTFEHDTYISLAFKVKSGTQEQAMTYVNQNFTLGGNAVSAEANGTQFVVIRQKDISVKNLMNDIALGFGGNTYTVNAKQYMTLANAGTNENLKNVCKSLYNYYLCATE
ncbi:MAG: leucine-rich repeat protein [Oscillospiraceae bacterium]|nr:leucine-rich repeat protein [Oscillospiraceae bacterium]